MALSSRLLPRLDGLPVADLAVVDAAPRAQPHGEKDAAHRRGDDMLEPVLPLGRRQALGQVGSGGMDQPVAIGDAEVERPAARRCWTVARGSRPAHDSGRAPAGRTTLGRRRSRPPVPCDTARRAAAPGFPAPRSQAAVLPRSHALLHLHAGPAPRSLIYRVPSTACGRRAGPPLTF